MSQDEEIKKGLIKITVAGGGAVIWGPVGATIGGAIASGVADVLYAVGKSFSEATGIDLSIPDNNKK